MREFVRRHRRELDETPTAIVNVDSVSHGESVRYLVSQGPAISQPLDAGLIELCDSLAAADREGEDRFRAAPLRYPQIDDALPAAIRGVSAITIIDSFDGNQAPWYHRPDDVPEHVDAETLTRATDFALGLARLLDRDAGRRFAGGTSEEHLDSTEAERV